ncbi:hypothetical protein PIB30_098779 [Stylosanthes scabra]|uniref:Uncharacterized protein n=1 Tax=Stylosanthes scabra TaxID=79078 RepID=A0ABU6YUW5_9FABA|nr:hypothetical protein [Stylosanthes scabra]
MRAATAVAAGHTKRGKREKFKEREIRGEKEREFQVAVDPSHGFAAVDGLLVAAVPETTTLTFESVITAVHRGATAGVAAAMVIPTRRKENLSPPETSTPPSLTLAWPRNANRNRNAKLSHQPGTTLPLSRRKTASLLPGNTIAIGKSRSKLGNAAAAAGN